MRFPFLTAVSVALLLALPGKAPAQQAKQPDVPDAPLPQKKPLQKPANASSPEAPSDSQSLPPAANPSTGQNDNAFPEAVSRDAAKPPAAQNDNAFPEAVSRDAAKAAQQDEKSSDTAPSGQQTGTSKTGSSDSNPFPDDVSRGAAREAGNDTPPDRDTPGVSSSQSPGSIQEPGADLPVQDPVRAQKDTDVANFYLKNGNYQGALLRFQEASKTDPNNVAAIFGLAETQQLMGKMTDAVRNYQLYLEIVPNGPKAKESLKALKVLQAKK